MWDKKYGRDTYFYGIEPNGFLAANQAKIPMGHVLCLAEGEGRNAVFLAGLGYHVTAVDQSIVGIEKGRRLAVTKNVDVNFIHADLADFDFATQQWSGVISVFCHLPPNLRTTVHISVIKNLIPSGVFLLEGYSPQQLANSTGGPKDVSLLMSAQDLRVELAGLNLLHLIETEREIIEGTGHSGVGAVVQAIGSKPL